MELLTSAGYSTFDRCWEVRNFTCSLVLLNNFLLPCTPNSLFTLASGTTKEPYFLNPVVKIFSAVKLNFSRTATSVFMPLIYYTNSKYSLENMFSMCLPIIC